MKIILGFLLAATVSVSAQIPIQRRIPFFQQVAAAAVGSGDFTNGLKVWFVATNIAPGITYGNGATITNWVDNIGNNINTGNATPATTPYYSNSVSVLNGKPGVVFTNGTYLEVTNCTQTATNYTIFISYVAFDGAQAGEERIVAFSAGSARLILDHNNASKLAWYDGSFHTTATNSTLAGLQLVEWVLNSTGTAGLMYRNGAVLMAAAAYTQCTMNSSDNFSIGADAGGGSNNFHGIIYEIRIYLGALSTTDRQTVEAAMKGPLGL